MNELTLHPDVYATGASKGLISLLERMWVREHRSGDGSLLIMSAFGNYNGGVRFFETFRRHVVDGGNLIAIFAGSANARLTSKQVVSELLGCGADVHIVNRKRLLHAKCYGRSTSTGDSLIVTSGNFTGPGMAQNAELSVLLDADTATNMKFSWQGMLDGVLSQSWDFYRPALNDLTSPAWRLLYDEQAANIVLDTSEKMTMVLRLGHADTARIQAAPKSDASKGTQYFWLSKDCYDFFPALTIRNKRGSKATYSALISLDYKDLNFVDSDCRVTFEAENNLDFRLGTGALRNTRLAADGDLAAISRVGESSYELRLFRAGSSLYQALEPFAIHFIGHQGKKYGYITNRKFTTMTGIVV